MDEFLRIPKLQVEELSRAFEDLVPVYDSSSHAIAETEKFQRLHQAIIDLRYVSLKIVSGQCAALAQEIATQKSTEVSLTCSGFEFLVPQEIAAVLSLMAMHGIRNALDHGRAKTLDFSAQFESGQLVFQVRDDGVGLDLSKIGLRAIELQVADASEVNCLSDEEKTAFLFRAGFSTREPSEITEWSGRGIGLDAVQNAIQSVRGIVTLRPHVDGGCVLRAEIPLSSVCVAVKKISGKTGACLFVHRNDSSPDYRVFRQLEEVWKKSGPPWLKRCFELSGGPVFVTRISGDEGFPFAVLVQPEWISELS